MVEFFGEWEIDESGKERKKRVPLIWIFQILEGERVLSRLGIHFQLFSVPLGLIRI